MPICFCMILFYENLPLIKSFTYRENELSIYFHDEKHDRKWFLSQVKEIF